MRNSSALFLEFYYERRDLINPGRDLINQVSTTQLPMFFHHLYNIGRFRKFLAIISFYLLNKEFKC